VVEPRVVEPEVAPVPPASAPEYSPATQDTIDWIAEMEAATPDAGPSTVIDSPAPSHVPGTGIRRCAGADGSAVFTDRRCEELGAVESAAPAAGAAGGRLFVRSCARTRQALVDGLRDALDARDANRVASYYHWTGMGNRAAYALMERLHDFSQQPLMDVQLVTSERPEADRFDDGFGAWYPMLPLPDTDQPPPPPRRPDLVRVDQMRSYNDAASQVTYFHLTPNAGCWWVHF
jgi:hypothetical protein